LRSRYVLKSDDGRFFATWKERHPELGTFDEYFPSAGYSFDPEFAERTPARLKQWGERARRMRSKHYAEEISRQDAYPIIAWFWLPKEFHAEAGL
jgi:hypothetical protein